MYAELYRDSVGIEIKIKNLMITYLCDPDYCIYTASQNEKPVDADTTNIRSAGQVKARSIEIYRRIA